LTEPQRPPGGDPPNPPDVPPGGDAPNPSDSAPTGPGSDTPRPSSPLWPEPTDPPPGRPGASIFTIEGRAAPGIYLVGWLATVIGLGLVLVGIRAAGGPGGIIFIAGLLSLGVGLVAGAGSQALERRSRREPYAGPSPFVVFAASIPLTLIAVIPFALLGLGITPAITFLTLVITAAIYVGLVRLLVVGTGALTWADMGFARRPAEAVSDALFGAGLALPILFVTLVAAAILVGALGTTPPSPLPEAHDLLGFGLNLIAAAVIAPLGEETMFRGFATTAWARSMGPARAIVRSAIFFALVHVLTVGGPTFSEAFRAAIIAFLVRLPVAFGLGWAFVTRRSIYASIGLHATFNATALILAALGSSFQSPA
jgi:membrane protease YdiL (CAAX protease family)